MNKFSFKIDKNFYESVIEKSKKQDLNEKELNQRFFLDKRARIGCRVYPTLILKKDFIERDLDLLIQLIKHGYTKMFGNMLMWVKLPPLEKIDSMK